MRIAKRRNSNIVLLCFARADGKEDSTAIGDNAQATGLESTATGASAEAFSDGSTATGAFSTAGHASTATGAFSTAAGFAGTATGASAQATGDRLDFDGMSVEMQELVMTNLKRIANGE